MANVLYDDDKERAAHAGVIHEIAQQSGLPEQEVGQFYEQELARLKQKARVKEFLPVLLRRSVWENLRQAPH
jgi:HD superfamily phosphohydrolase YqeK